MIIVNYTENCSSKKKEFVTKEEADQWVLDFLLKYQLQEGGYYIEQILDGNIIFNLQDTVEESE